ncbi:uncharacterized protein HKW66_Vig0168240 [Vigna angularis]|uniref:Uncharacterized protein n=1 Tax=Phaseolus angularis TaxID=3914 RepID=A0A8T0JP61_PHAAN|nr:uncharacterized protein HKW66_Vig0168240 [Vigna angularis]
MDNTSPISSNTPPTSSTPWIPNPTPTPGPLENPPPLSLNALTPSSLPEIDTSRSTSTPVWLTTTPQSPMTTSSPAASFTPSPLSMAVPNQARPASPTSPASSRAPTMSSSLPPSGYLTGSSGLDWKLIEKSFRFETDNNNNGLLLGDQRLSFKNYGIRFSELFGFETVAPDFVRVVPVSVFDLDYSITSAIDVLQSVETHGRGKNLLKEKQHVDQRLIRRCSGNGGTTKAFPPLLSASSVSLFRLPWKMIVPVTGIPQTQFIGELSDASVVAVKRLERPWNGEKEFRAEAYAAAKFVDACLCGKVLIEITPHNNASLAPATTPEYNLRIL